MSICRHAIKRPTQETVVKILKQLKAPGQERPCRVRVGRAPPGAARRELHVGRGLRRGGAGRGVLYFLCRYVKKI